MQPLPSRRNIEKINLINAESRKDSELQVHQTFSAAPARVFQAWLDPALNSHWLFATATRPMAPICIDTRPGGLFEFADNAGTREHGRYLEIQPGRLLAFSLARPGARRGSKVVVEFSRRGSGCLLGLTHSGLPAGQIPYMEARWEGMLYGLGLLLDEAGSESIAEKSPRATASRRPPLTRG